MAIRQRRCVRISRRTRFASLPHSGQMVTPRSAKPAMLCQHFGHRARPRGRSQKIAQSATAPASATNAHTVRIMTHVATIGGAYLESGVR